MREGGDVVAGVAHVGQRHAVESAVVLADGEKVGQHLGGVPGVGEPVVHRDAGVAGQGLDRLLGVAAVLDGVVHAAEHARGVLDRFLGAELQLVPVHDDRKAAFLPNAVANAERVRVDGFS